MDSPIAQLEANMNVVAQEPFRAAPKSRTAPKRAVAKPAVAKPAAAKPAANFGQIGKEQSPSPTAQREKLSRKDYEKELQKLQVELCHLQDWVRATGARVVIVLEGRDTAGKGGLIKRLAERVSPRTFRVVALSAPDERERSKLYL